MKRVIVTADDFGASPQVNRAVIQAHRKGILTCASLMVSGRAAEEAIRLARSNRSLRVGLHLVLVDGRSVLKPEQIPDLVDADRRFGDNPAVSGVRTFFSRRVKRQVVRECRAQIEAFLATGLPMDHLNSHHHLHIHPTIAQILVNLAKGYRIRAIRLPYQGLRTLNRNRAVMAAVMLPWVIHLKLRLQMAGIDHNREIFGLYETGAMREETWLKLIPRLKPGTTEIFCHPADGSALPGPNIQSPDLRIEEFKALLSKRVKDRLLEHEVVLTGFSR
jgi:hopanoid biosynthesis associated protein HpnK